MEKIQEALVVENNGALAKIKVQVHANCENCGSCSSTDIIITAENSINAQAGQRVKVLMPDNSSVKITFIIFFLPLLLIFAGIYLGKIAALKFHYNQNLLMTLVGAALFIISIILIIAYDRRSKLNVRNTAKIIEIIS